MRPILALLALLPVLAIPICIAAYGVNSPHWDEWYCEGNVLRAFLAREPLGPVLWQNCNESRPVLPKLLWLAAAIATDHNQKVNMFIGWLVVCGTAWNLWRIGGRSASLALPANALLFHPGQHENWLWGIEYFFFLPAFFLTVMWRVMHSTQLSARSRALLAGGIAVLSSYSYSNGFLAWPALFAIALFAGERRRWPWFAWAFWVALLLAAIPVYFVGLDRMPDTAASLSSPWRMVQYFFLFLGGPLSSGRVAWAAGIAALLLAGLWSLRPRTLNFWTLMAGYALASAALASAGRSGTFGLHQALENRYMAFALWLPLGLAGLTVAAWPTARLGMRVWLSALWAMLAVAYASSYAHGLREQKNRSAAQRYQRACLHFAKVLPNEECTPHYPVWSLEYLLKAAPPLSDAGWLKPPMARSLKIPEDVATGTGGLEIDEDGAEWLVRGAVQGDPDAVVIASRKAPGSWTVRAVVIPLRTEGEERAVRFQVRMRKERLPAGETAGVFGYSAHKPVWTRYAANEASKP